MVIIKLRIQIKIHQKYSNSYRKGVRKNRGQAVVSMKESYDENAENSKDWYRRSATHEPQLRFWRETNSWNKDLKMKLISAWQGQSAGEIDALV